jgi:hypothetical protein
VITKTVQPKRSKIGEVLRGPTDREAGRDWMLLFAVTVDSGALEFIQPHVQWVQVILSSRIKRLDLEDHHSLVSGARS